MTDQEYERAASAVARRAIEASSDGLLEWLDHRGEDDFLVAILDAPGLVPRLPVVAVDRQQWARLVAGGPGAEAAEAVLAQDAVLTVVVCDGERICVVPFNFSVRTLPAQPGGTA